jgi:hypothetical protein
MPNQEDRQEEEGEGRNVGWMLSETVCVFCVLLLLQTATLNVLLQTAQFQHLQSPKKNKKQSILSSDFFFHFAQVPTTYIIFASLWVFAICSLGSQSHSLSTNIITIGRMLLCPSYWPNRPHNSAIVENNVTMTQMKIIAIKLDFFSVTL